jgi:oxygen-independent coproporphyrinogen-3 oxidase
MEYEACIEHDEFPIKKGLAVDDDDLLRAEVIQALMCYDALDYDAFGAQHDVDFRQYFAAEVKRLEPLAEDDLIDLDEAGIRITPKGRLLLRNIAMMFDRYIGDEENNNRFSKAI